MERAFKQRTVHGAIWSVSSQGVTFVLGIISTGVLARLVLPEAYGLIAMVMVVIGFGEMLRDFGLTNAVIQAPRITEAEKSNLFWLSTSIGLLLSIFVFLLATPIERFYENESVGVITRWFALAFLINGMATQPRANLVRDLRIRAVAIIDVLSNSIAVILAIVMALMGAQFWALVALKLCRDIVMLVASFVADGRIPRLPDRNADVKGFMHFGMLTFAARVPVYLSNNIGTALIGRQLNANVLGFRVTRE